jgi:hypothetical protein
MKSEFCEFLLDGIPITWQDLIKEAFHYANLNNNKEFCLQTKKLLAQSIDVLNFLGYKVKKNPDYKQI